MKSCPYKAALYFIHYTLYIIHYTLFIMNYALCIMNCTFYVVIFFFKNEMPA